MFTTVSAAKHGNEAFYMLNVIWKFIRREDEVTEGEWRSDTVLCFQFVITLKLHQLHLQGGRGFVHRELKKGSEQLEARSQWLDTCGFVNKPTRGDNIQDLVFSTKNSLVGNITTGPEFGNSDYRTVSFNVSLVDYEENVSEEHVYINRKDNFEKLRKILSDTDWSKVENETDVNKSRTKFYNILNMVVDYAF